MINRREFLVAGTALAVQARSRRAETEEPPRRAPNPERHSPKPSSPNVLIFMPDQQNGQTILPGSPVVKPTLDRFLREAVTFTRAHCPAPHCCPSRASFMTGLYPSEHGVYNNVDTTTAIHTNPYPGTPYWGRALRAAGYNMGYAGKLHVGRDVTTETCGFEDVGRLERTSLRSTERQEVEQWRRARRLLDENVTRRAGEILRPGWDSLQLYRTVENDEGDSADERVVQDGIAAMQRMAQQGRPWCLMISNSGAHDPYNVPKRFVDLYDPRSISLPESFCDLLEDKPRVYQRMRFQYWSQLSDDESRDALRHYYAKCSMQDALFGQILEALEKSGQKDNTIVIYVSDHGDYHGAHGLWMKGVPSFREAYHIPAVIRWPAKIVRPGRQVDEFVDQVDWAVTILEACGVSSPSPLSGRSLLPWLRDEQPSSWRQATCTQMNGVELYYSQRIVMTKNWKYVYNGFDYDELYDLERDPHEMTNLAFPDLVKERELAGLGRKDSSNPRPWPALPTNLDRERERLLSNLWQFATEHRDMIFNEYGTVALSPLGPALGPNPHPDLI